VKFLASLKYLASWHTRKWDVGCLDRILRERRIKQQKCADQNVALFNCFPHNLFSHTNNVAHINTRTQATGTSRFPPPPSLLIPTPQPSSLSCHISTYLKRLVASRLSIIAARTTFAENNASPKGCVCVRDEGGGCGAYKESKEKQHVRSRGCAQQPQ